MIITKPVFENMINSPIRTFKGRVEVFQGSTLALICGCHDYLINFKVERVGEKNKFFGYGICQKLTTEFRDTKRELNITKEHSLEVEFGVGSDYIYPCPSFQVDDVQRDENTNNLTITAYDALYAAAAHTVSELDLPISYTIGQFAEICAALLGIPMKTPEYESFNTVYSTGANFDGTETIREALNAIAEATQTIYYIDKDWELVFKRLDINGVPVAVIDKTKYIDLDSKDTYTLSTIVHTTELGDNVSASTGLTGMTQYVRDNPFWEMREDIGGLVNSALEAAGRTSITGFTCSWRGNFLLEIGDKIGLITKDDSIITTYILDDVFSFDGGLSGNTQWSYEDNKTETHSNPSTLGEALKQTYARVDKANKQIELIASETSANSSNITSIRQDTDSINASVSSLEKKLDSSIENNNTAIEELTKKVEVAMTDEQVQLAISTELAKGTDKVTTSTGFTFNEEGLTVSKSDSEMETTITEDGMTVSKNGDTMLTANNKGVEAINLNASTYLIIGKNSRFEDYGNDRTACFWIGG